MGGIIALMTDFGLRDSYVGVMKGVMLGVHPEAKFVDVTHEIPPQAVRGGALTLLNCYRFFPRETVFLTIVDPGVGSTRRPVAVKTADYLFVAPDNGVLSYVLREQGAYTAVVLDSPLFQRSERSNTFHGRDIFAPAAAYLARGDVLLERLGSPAPRLHELPLPPLEISEKRIEGEVVRIDHFGNLITSIGKMRWVGDDRILLERMVDDPHADRTVRIDSEKAQVVIAGERLYGIRHAYHEVDRGQLLAQVDSNGYLEIAVNQGNAAQRLQVTVGDPIEIVLA